ncbi:MAG: ribosome silencing factor [Firmicutes bacterium]|nr:ribosome silencing factor [Bacillota bacterium]MCL1953189.1 ribosome silencing factor [Bacillota bacterium]
MKKQLNKPEGLELAKIIAGCILDKKGSDIVAIKLENISTIADYFVIASANNNIQVRSIAESIDEVLSKQYNIEPLRREGLQEARWVALDYSTVIVHIFLTETRQFYQLERLWINEDNLIKYENL